MFVVDRRATGDDIVRISTGFSEYRILADRRGAGGVEVSLSLLRFERNVKALEMDDIISPRDGSRSYYRFDAFALRRYFHSIKYRPLSSLSGRDAGLGRQIN